MSQIQSLERYAVEVRKNLLKIIFAASSGHTGGSLSCVDILVALYFGVMKIDPDNPGKPDRDRFIMSKGHSVEALYAVLAKRGFIKEEILGTYGKYNSPLAGHLEIKIPGVELNSGSLGHGLSVGVGMALAAKRSNMDYKVVVLMGDGEHGEGSISEAITAASHYKLDNLIVIVDRNRLQISGNTEDVMALGNLAERYKAYGWNTLECDGNNISDIIETLSSIKNNSGKPTSVIAYTIKGKGVSFIENRTSWHHRVPTIEELNAAICELDNLLKLKYHES
ncbi:MAG: transketolase [Bacteroidetes bacterium RBG_13_43_22]|nr:MAG: transketolase [Bacteroidetes bacterium RBG_13_43_22]OFY78549.1 MAG: transketolase [Bacteroidetes bacterium RBG_19FT_COMBO_42_7]